MNKFIESKWCIGLAMVIGVILTILVLVGGNRIYHGYDYGDSLEYTRD